MADGVDLAAKNRDACWPALSAAVAAGLKKRPAPDLDKLFPIIQVSPDPKSHVRLHWEGAKERESLTVRKLGVEVRNLYEVRAIMPIAADQMDPELNPYILPVVTAWSSTSQQHILDWIVEQMVQAAHDGGVLDPVALNSHLPWGKLPMRVIVFTADENAVKAVKLLADTETVTAASYATTSRRCAAMLFPLLNGPSVGVLEEPTLSWQVSDTAQTNGIELVLMSRLRIRLPDKTPVPTAITYGSINY